ncbi:hypothetical protein AALP_AA2G037000 [Arabis alpina]|uniref:Glabrous enhancer-binding protein-like C-terminal domain-containing protein n=1 Tax=Arabis alpina TaxID=50452 RepID=A0A087HF55_ARAAL|nr:hypothetical protein AALP_AA2G037000 [Arabis alpina]
MAKENHIKAEPSSEDDYEMEPDEEEEMSDSDSESETDESDTENAVTVADKEKKFSLINRDWFEKSGLAQSISILGSVSEEDVKSRWIKVSMEKKLEIANKRGKLHIEKFRIATLKAKLVSAIYDVISSGST